MSARIDVTEAELPVGDHRVAIALATPADVIGPGPAALLVHGWTSAQHLHDRAVGERLAGFGITSLSLDLPGHGRSSGEREAVVLGDFLRAVTAAYDHLAAHTAVDIRRITVVGSSFGAYLSMRLTAQRPVENLVLRVPGNFPDGFDNHPMGAILGDAAREWRGRALPAGATAAMRALQSFGGKVLLLEAGDDVVVPHQTVVNLRDSVRPGGAQHVVIPGAPHVLYTDPVRGMIADDVIYSWMFTHTGLARVEPSAA
jgi:pimeloyl-ACP methyl ester carboxylesterase